MPVCIFVDYKMYEIHTLFMTAVIERTCIVLELDHAKDFR